jgi:signal transduction histidine kinase
MRWRQSAAARDYGVEPASTPVRRPAAHAPRSSPGKLVTPALRESPSGKLAAAIAHEIRTPLAVALMYIRLVEQEAGPHVKAPLREGLSQARDEVARLDRLLGNLVDLHRLGHVVTRPVLVDAGRVVSDAVRRARIELSSAQVSVEVGAADLLDWWDPNAIEQIIQKLLSNAVRYGEGRPVSVTVNRVDSSLRLRVQDAGSGIPAAERARLFRLRRGSRAARSSGLGLGLWLVRELAEAHAGSVAVDSRKGAGSTFTVMLRPKRP